MWVLLALLAAEFAAAAVLVVVLLVELVVDVPASLGTAVALLALTAVFAAGLGSVLVGVWRGRAWVRALAVVAQVLTAAIGLGALQGALAQPAWGWPLVLVGGLGFILLITKPVAGWLVRRDE